MTYLFVAGVPKTGKTTLITAIRNTLIGNGYELIPDDYPPPPAPDFKCILTGRNRMNENRKVLINSPSDDPARVREFLTYLSEYRDVDVVITSIRAWGDNMRNVLLDGLNISNVTDFQLELALGERTNRNQSDDVLIWYQQAQLGLALHVLGLPPYALL